MPVTIHLVRHAQGFHNLSRENEALHDPDLTELGKQQCAELRVAFPYHEKVTRLFASPLRRTLSTCKLSFGAKDNSHVCHQVFAIPEIQEVSDAPCDTGSDVTILQQEFKDSVDLSKVNDGWNSIPPWTTWQAKTMATETRARKARLIIQESIQELGNNDHVIIVSHGAFLHFLTEDFSGVKPLAATAWKNTEYRSYVLTASEGSSEEVYLDETLESWTRRRGNAPRPTKKEQDALRDFYYHQLEPHASPKEYTPSLNQ